MEPTIFKFRKEITRISCGSGDSLRNAGLYFLYAFEEMVLRCAERGDYHGALSAIGQGC